MTTPRGPQIEGVTVRDGDMQVEITSSMVYIQTIGPQGGVKPATRFTRAQMTQLMGLLKVSEDHQKHFAAKQIGAGS